MSGESCPCINKPHHWRTHTAQAGLTSQSGENYSIHVNEQGEWRRCRTRNCSHQTRGTVHCSSCAIPLEQKRKDREFYRAINNTPTRAPSPAPELPALPASALNPVTLTFTPPASATPIAADFTTPREQPPVIEEDSDHGHTQEPAEEDPDEPFADQNTEHVENAAEELEYLDLKGDAPPPEPEDDPDDEGAADMAENDNGSRSLVAKPDFFDGTKSKYQEWRRQVKFYLLGNRRKITDEEDKIITVLSFMKGGVAGQYADAWVEEDDHEIDTITKLWGDLDKHFQIDEKHDAYQKMKALKQGSSTAIEFFQQFEKYAKQAGYAKLDDHSVELVELIEENVHPASIKTIYNSAEPVPTEYSKYKARIEQIDANYQRGKQRQAGRTTTSAPKATPRPLPATQTTPAPRAPAPTPAPAARRDGTGITFGGRGQPMDLDRARRNGECFRCGVKGHMARDCPQKPAQNIRGTSTELPDEAEDRASTTSNTSNTEDFENRIRQIMQDEFGKLMQGFKKAQSKAQTD